MKFIFLLNTCLLFLLPFIKCNYILSSENLFDYKNGDCTVEDLSLTNVKTKRNTIHLNQCTPSKNYTINLKVNIPETNYDLLEFSVDSDDIQNPQISFFIKASDTEAFKLGNSVKVKLSDIISGSYYLKISFEYYGDKKLKSFKLKNSFSSYKNTKRFRDNDIYILNPDDTKKIFLYEMILIHHLFHVHQIFQM